jgi:hypothetical protein
MAMVSVAAAQRARVVKLGRHTEGERMELTPEQRRELENLGAATIHFKLLHSGAGRGAAVGGFRCGEITRGDIEDWLGEKISEETALQASTLFWARIAGVAAVISVLLFIAQWFFPK